MRAQRAEDLLLDISRGDRPMISRRTASMLLGVAVVLSSAHTLGAQLDPERPPVVTNHQILINGRQLAYTAEVGRIAIRDVETGEPHAYMFYTAYRVASPGKQRPVTFIWNGGPGWPALPLHFEVAGPKRGEGDRLVDNADTWLTESDLVMVDPVGTGWSRATKPEYVKEFAIIVGDVMAEAEFIRSWLLLHDAEGAPGFGGGGVWLGASGARRLCGAQTRIQSGGDHADLGRNRPARVRERDDRRLGDA